MTSPIDSGDLLHFFDLCASIEELFADLYHFYSRLFSDNGDAARLWRKTALEEEDHHVQVELAVRACDGTEKLADGVLERSHRLHRNLQSMVNDAKVNPPSLEVALGKAIEIEERVADLHVECAIHFRSEATQHFFRTMRDFDRDHITALRRQLAIETAKR
jgi:hypothetical protein